MMTRLTNGEWTNPHGAFAKRAHAAHAAALKRAIKKLEDARTHTRKKTWRKL